jgi:hypothetical protein
MPDQFCKPVHNRLLSLPPKSEVPLNFSFKGNAGMPMDTFAAATQTMYAELVQRTLDADFDRDFDASGQFVLKRRKGRGYWYFQTYDGARQRQAYVGPQNDPAVSDRVARFTEIKVQRRDSRELVRALAAAGLPTIPPFAGDLLDAFGKAGLFRLRGVLVGSVAYQTYAGLLGVRLPGELLVTGDVDFAQFHAISMLVDDTLPPVLDLLRGVDPSFQPVPHVADPHRSTKFVNAARFEVEFLTPNRASPDVQGKPAAMPALGGAGAQPLRFLDFLIRDPVRAVVLHRAGIPVTVPAPPRFAVHKMIVTSRRRRDPAGAVKAVKDAAQAGALIEALAITRRAYELGEAWAEAWDRGPSWRAALMDGRSRLSDGQRATLDRAATSFRDGGGDRGSSADASQETAGEPDFDPNSDGL